MDKLACIFLLGFLGLGTTNIQAQTISGQMEFLTTATDFEGDTGTTGRRDPSDIIKVADRFHVWYSRMQNGVTSGYDASIWHASSFDGVNWTEHGEAVARGGADEFDQFSAFTPNIIFDDDTYYLYWTGIGQPGVGLASKRTAIGVATSNSPFGPWVKYAGNPIVQPTADAGKFDSFRIDDTALLHKDGDIFLYYKGRQQGRSPRETKMGLARSESPLGPFVRLNDGESVQPAGHEVLVWQGADDFIYSRVDGIGARQFDDIKYTIRRSLDGINFEPYVDINRQYPVAPGMYRPELTNPGAGQSPSWGLSGTRQLGYWAYDYADITTGLDNLGSRDIGPTFIGGSLTNTELVQTIEASGNDIWGTNDAFHFASQTHSGDGELVTRVSSVSPTHQWAKAGVMFRDSLETNAPNVLVFMRSDKRVAMQVRDATGALTNRLLPRGSGIGDTSNPKFLKLTRSGNLFTGYYSIDGESWIKLDEVTVNLTPRAQVGLAVTSHNDTSLTSAVFTNSSLVN